MLAAVTDPIKRLNLEWDLYGYPPTPALVRDSIPAYFAEALALPDPKARVEQLGKLFLTANRSGLFSMQREARAEMLMTAATTKDAETLPLSYLDLNASECLEQAIGPERDSFLNSALSKFVAAGNVAAAQALAPKLGQKFADAAQAALLPKRMSFGHRPRIWCPLAHRGHAGRQLDASKNLANSGFF